MTGTDHGAGRRTVVVAVTLTLLLGFARSGAPSLTLQLFFTLFVVAATLWIRGQYLDSLDHHQWLISRRTAMVLIVVAVALVAAFLVWHSAGTALLGILVLYFLAGTGVTWLRQGPLSEERRLVLALALLGVGAVLALVGVLVLGGGEGTAWVVLELALLGLACFALLPVGLAVFSEVAVRRLCAGPSPHRLRVGLAGLVLYLAAVALMWWLTRSPWLLGAIVVLSLLVVAMTSTTQADIAFAMAVIALLGVTPLPADQPAQLQPRRDGQRLLVSLGDSYMSGEGASTYYRGTDEGGGNQCRRSPTAWSAMAGQQRPFGRVEFLACSGAKTVNVQTGTLPVRSGAPAPEPQTGETGTQLDRYLHDYGPDYTPSLVVAGIGGNDAGFSTIGLMCLAPANCDDESRLWTDALPQVRAGLRDTYRQLDRLFPRTPIVVVPYPDPIDLDGRCDDVSLTARERLFLHEFVTGGLNAMVAQTANEFGFYYLGGMESALADAHLQLCDPRNQGRPGLNFIGVRSVRGIAEQRFNPKNWSHSSLHPNERGHTAMLQAFESWLPEDLDVLRPRLTAFPAEVAVTEAAVPRVEPPCDVLDTSPAGCRPRGMQWAKGQVGTMLLTEGWMGLVALAGIWLAAVAFFGDRRHHSAVDSTLVATPPKPREKDAERSEIGPQKIENDSSTAAGPGPKIK
ncbi:SGNH/GDSL hydrolase family protein [Winogradskya consettensis]|uniref:SGNH/GDSL hydrolase family protein n=1 Tax=Winogradskya consettensis TaxID=113560 RepID=UPI001BB382F4|nr:SGNH/GDSL hydrolase family protein [Actinoplanes consettensis]